MPRKRRTGLEKWGMALAAARDAAGKSVRQLADEVHLAIGSISNYENGKRMPGARELELIEAALGTNGRLKEAFDEWVEDISPEWSAWRDIEEHADMLFSYEHSVLPGLLQTEDYARAVLGHDPDSPLELDQRVRYRMERQAIFDSEKPATVVFIFRESALHAQVGSRETMYDQITHIVEMAQRPNIIVQIVPQDAGYHSGLNGAFLIAKLNRVEIAYQDGIWKGHVLKDDVAVSALSNKWQHILSKALTAEVSLDLLKREAEKWQD